MTYEIIRHPLVKNDLLKITVFVGDYAGYKIAEAKIDAIETSFRALKALPHIGSKRDEICPGLRVTTAATKAVVCFKVDETDRAVFIICVTYAGADWVSRVNERQ